MNKGKTKIAFVVMDDIFKSIGTTVRVHSLLELLYGKYNITVINCAQGNPKVLQGIEYVRVINLGNRITKFLMSKTSFSPIKLFYIVLWNPKLAFVLLRNKFDVVYCAFDFVGFMSIYLVSRIRKYKIIYEAHSMFSEDIKAAGYPWIMVKLSQVLEKFIVSHADFVIALSDNTLNSYETYNNRIVLLPVFIDTKLFKSKNRVPEINSKLIGVIGPFVNVRHKHYLDFIYKNNAYFDNRIKFLAIGACNNIIENERIEYTGYLPNVNDYVAQLSRLDAVLVPEVIFTTGPLTKILEPMSCSLPVFTTPEGTVGLNGIEPGRNIFVYQKNDLVEKINAMLFNDELMLKIGTEARKMAERYYSKEAIMEKLLGVLDSVING
jgi:glycosyltransferase involved in cell wall biosynthesis